MNGDYSLPKKLYSRQLLTSDINMTELLKCFICKKEVNGSKIQNDIFTYLSLNLRSNLHHDINQTLLNFCIKCFIEDAGELYREALLKSIRESIKEGTEE